MRVADLVFDFFVGKGVRHVFSVTGGGAMFLNDAMAKNKELKSIFNHHEQASAMAALAYAKVTNKFGLVCVTTGCGGTNAITGLLDAWQDSTPVIFISGQCKLSDTMGAQNTTLRQHGVQEANIIDIVKSITKYSVMITKKEDIRYVLEKAYYFANSGRPGPVWIDIPMDIQSSEVDFNLLRQFDQNEIKNTLPLFDVESFKKIVSNAKRPLVLAGNGIHLSNTKSELNKFIKDSGIPVVTTFLGVDLVDSSSEKMLGAVGIKGVRSANFAMQNADLLICLGTRLSIPVTGYTASDFAPKAKILVVDIDADEHKKTSVRVDHFFHTDLKNFFNNCNGFSFDIKQMDPKWLVKLQEWKTKWSIFNEPHVEAPNELNIYAFLKTLNEISSTENTFVSDAGSAYYCTAQALSFKADQRYITSGAQADMGFTLPACMGAFVANSEKTIWGVTGDGSFATNLQEIFTAIGYEMNIKIIVLNNNGYLSIKATQKKFFAGDYVGTDKSNGVFFPELSTLSKAFNISYHAVRTIEQSRKAIAFEQNKKGFSIIEVFCPEFQEVIPTLSSKKDANGRIQSRPLHDMYPFLSEEEVASNMFN